MATKKTMVKKALPKAQKGISTGKPTYSSNYFERKSYTEPTEKDRYTNSYAATKKGIVRSTRLGLEHTKNLGGRNVISLPEKSTSMDTTGYSKGKSTYTIKQQKNNISDGTFGTKSYNEWTIPRSKVKSTIAQMKKGTGMNKKEAAAKKSTTKKK
jgi:hypothetical protein